MESKQDNGDGKNLHLFKFDPYKPEVEKLNIYFSRFELACDIYGVKSMEDMRALFIRNVGGETYSVIADNFDITGLKKVSFMDIKEFLQDYFIAKTSFLLERFNFHKRERKDDESFSTYAHELKRAAKNCRFGNSLEERLRDQFVVGLRHKRIQEELFARIESPETLFSDILKISTSLESAEKDRAKLDPVGEQNICAVKQQGSKDIQDNQPKTKICRRCGENWHQSWDACKAVNKLCGYCGTMGHFSKVCLKRKRNNNIYDYKQINRKLDTNNDFDIVYLPPLINRSIKRIYDTGSAVVVDVKLNGVDIKMDVDTGATVSCINENIWNLIGAPKLGPAPSLKTYMNHNIPTRGQTNIVVELNAMKLQLQIIVVKGDEKPIFGLNWFRAFNLTFDVIRNIAGTNKYQHHISELIKKYQRIFDVNNQSITTHKASIRLCEDAKPIIHRPRLVPFSLRSKVETEINRLVKQGILVKVDDSINNIEWATPIVNVIKSDGTVRICGDFKVTINKHIKLNHYPLPRFDEITNKISGNLYFS
ncbi:Transposon Ty3-G Gag-Pol polyprotein [Thelohanellus kitauei]|uniref:Transposon Ty3-G Gag-Pol polyprotein n=1 Tax=Thelohanellus kitauei TaxID=669202 RepID=A0A0C2MK22_THEKT|nr:Transposon Ty3-G Gag-Pol polyprotein [Thelohanellus kitauei]